MNDGGRVKNNGLLCQQPFSQIHSTAINLYRDNAGPLGGWIILRQQKPDRKIFKNWFLVMVKIEKNREKL